MKNTEIVNGKRVGAGYTWAQLRELSEVIFHTNAHSDTTQTFLLPFSTDYEYYSNGFPKIYRFEVIKNDNINITAANGILDLLIPIIPVGWDINSRQDMDDFVKNAKNLEAIKNKCSQLNKQDYERIINERILEAYNYIIFSLADRYVEALKHGDEKTVALIKNMAIMQESGFDFNKFLKLKEKGIGHAIFIDPQFGLAYTSYLRTKEKYQQLLKDLYNYKIYDVQEEIKNKNTNHTKSMFYKSNNSESQPDGSQPGEE